MNNEEANQCMFAAVLRSQLVVLTASLLLAFIVAAVPLLFISKYCKPASVENAETQVPEADKSGVASISKSLQSIRGMMEADRRERKREGWWHGFACDMKVTDFFLATFTFFLVVVGAWQGWHLQRTVDLARDEFNATHYPRIELRRLQLRWEAEKRGINMVIANVGEANAAELRMNANIQILPREWRVQLERESLPPYGNNWIDLSQLTGQPTLRPRERRFVFIAFPPETSEEDMQSIRNGEAVLFFFGLIDFLDQSGVRRDSGFFRTYERPTFRFAASEDPDYEWS